MSHKLQKRDRLSELPDSLLITVLTFLEITDAVRTSVLSKRWVDLWTTAPSLILRWPRAGVADSTRYQSFLIHALLRWRGNKILRFDLSFSYIFPRDRDIDSYLLFAIGKQVEELRLSLGHSRDFILYSYSPPHRFYSCTSIRRLTLRHVELRIPENVELSQLTSLTLEGSRSLSELGMTRLLSCAPMLEELVLLYMDILQNYNIRSESLKKLQIGNNSSGSMRIFTRLNIWAPNLSTLEIGGWVYARGFRLHFDVAIPSLTTAILRFEDNHSASKLNFEDFPLLGMFYQFFQRITHAKTLTLSHWSIKLLVHLKKKDMRVEFSNAKYVELYLDGDEPVDETLFAVLEMFPNLVTLIFHYTPPPKDDDRLYVSEKIDLPLPHLKTCEIRLPKISPSILPAIQPVLGNGEVLEKMFLRVRNGEALDFATLEKVMSMRRSPRTAILIII